MSQNNFAVFILTYGRPEKQKTYKSLLRSGYTGVVYFVVDDSDPTIATYKKLYGERVLVFNKLEIVREFDQGDNFTDRRTIVYARNACFVLAKQLGIEYFIQLDDDYTAFVYRFNSDLQYRYKEIKQIDKVFAALLKFYKCTDALSVAMAQGGDFIGGKRGTLAGKICLKRKAMNSFICSTDRPFSFLGRINEDVNTYINLGSRGGLFLTTNFVSLQQVSTQKNTGGMTDVYLDSGTYLKSFYTVMYNPSCVKIGEMGDRERRIHHAIKWNHAVPKIISEQYKKA